MNNIQSWLLLSATEGGKKFFEFVLEEQLEPIDENRFENVLNPFYDDTKPSVSIYKEPDLSNGKKAFKWYYKDFGEPQYCGDVFSFAARYYQLDIVKDFQLIMQKMAEDLQIDIETISYNDEFYKSDFYVKGYELHKFSPTLERFNTTDFFKKFSIPYEICKEYNVALIKGYRYYEEGRKPITKTLSKDEILVAYQFDNFAKIYHPVPDKWFKYLGKKDKDYVFGLKQIESRLLKTKQPRKELIITGGEKDVLSLTALGYDAIALNSESSSIPRFLFDRLFCNYEKIIVFYDNDKTGLKAMTELCSRHKFWRVLLPEKINNKLVKDISNCMQYRINPYILHNLIANAERPFLPAANAKQSIVVNQPTEETAIVEDEIANVDDTITDEAESVSDTSKSICLHNHTKLLPQSVYDNLPDFLAKICDLFGDGTNKDLVLLSTLTVLSTCFPKVKGIYRNDTVGTNLYMYISAPAAGGKGNAKWSKRLINGIEETLKVRYINAEKDYRNKLTLYESNKKENPDLDKPEQPVRQIMTIPANSSATKMIEMLGDNGNFGLLFELEGDVVSNALKNDWSDSSTTLRFAFQHEPITLARKGGRGYYVVNEPHLSVLLTGTPRQVTNLIKNVENGLMSRFLFYNFKSSAEFVNPFINSDKDFTEVFKQLGDKVLSWWLTMENMQQCYISFTPEQQLLFTELFADKTNELTKLYGEDIVGSIRRMGLSHFRLCMVLTAIRTFTTETFLKEKMLVDDKDFLIATDIISTLFEHLISVFTQITEQGYEGFGLAFREQSLFDLLPQEFTWEQCKAVAGELQIAENTAGNYIRKYKTKGLIFSVKKGSYRKC